MLLNLHHFTLQIVLMTSVFMGRIQMAMMTKVQDKNKLLTARKLTGYQWENKTCDFTLFQIYNKSTD